jgi:hypothetical protein
MSTVNINDFAVVVKIIDTCATRGAFRGDELLAVGQLRQKFVDFVEAGQKAAQEESTSFTSEESDESAEVTTVSED